MERRIRDKYAELNKACRQYPAIELSSIEDRGGYVQRDRQPGKFHKPEGYAKDGFVENFCL